MKVLFILHLPPPIHGAAIVGGIIKDSEVINKRFDCRFINLGISGSIDDINKKNPQKIFRYLKILAKTFIQLVLFKPDICYMTPVSNGSGFYKDSVVILLVKLFCCKVVYHFHNKGVLLRQDKFLDDCLYRLVFRNASVILLSELLYTDIKKYVSPNKVFYCSNGIPPLENHRKIQNSTIVGRLNSKWYGINNEDSGLLNSNITQGSVKILFLSNLIRSKGIFTLVEACKILKSRKLNFHCIIIGDNGDLTISDLMEVIILKDLKNKITITGPRFGEEKFQLMSESDIMVHPTHSDCLPLVLLEAMQHSLPIVSTYEGAIPDIVEENVSGFLVHKDNAEELANKLEMLIVNKDLRIRMGRAGFARYDKNYKQEIFENNIANILDEIIKK